MKILEAQHSHGDVGHYLTFDDIQTAAPTYCVDRFVNNMSRLGHIQIISCFHPTRARIFTGEEAAKNRQSVHVVWQNESYVREGIAESRAPW